MNKKTIETGQKLIDQIETNKKAIELVINKSGPADVGPPLGGYRLSRTAHEAMIHVKKHYLSEMRSVLENEVTLLENALASLKDEPVVDMDELAKIFS